MFVKGPSTADIVAAVQSGKTLDVNAFMPGTGSLLLVSILGIAVFLAVNFTFLKNGQTIGKMLLKLQVQRRSDSTVLPFQDYILKRIAPMWAVSFAAVLIHPFINILLLVDALAIFRPQRNTLHDDIAGSKVVRLQQ